MIRKQLKGGPKMRKIIKNKKSKRLRKKSNRDNFNFKSNRKILFGSLIGISILILIFLVFFRNSYAQKNTENQETIELFSSSENMICKEFYDNVLWTSRYSRSLEGSENYQTWKIENNCPEAKRTSCFLQNISLNTRVLYVNPSETEANGKGYVQISNPDEAICNNPERGVYSKYLVYEEINGSEGQTNSWYCGEEKEETSKCGIKLSEKFNEQTSCYGIKAHASQYLIVDVIQIKYSWCWEKQN